MTNRPSGQADMESRLDLRPESCGRSKENPGEYDIEEPNADIAKAAAERREPAPPPCPEQFRQSDEEQAADGDGEGHRGSAQLNVEKLAGTNIATRSTTSVTHAIFSPPGFAAEARFGNQAADLCYIAGQLIEIAGASGADRSISPSPAIA